ncbi:class I SAM-dependent methyltransferase [Nocardia takedensis]|uniref:class I SAM-dependent methyltransferase n=1 Tax=Nocardia takedensis TaxID=259390 RepID=UPI0012F68115|nr:class I SAM-dependent methyltransferase [Nocardia takedensis]
MAVRTSVSVPEFALEILARSRVEGNKLFLTDRLSVSDYRKLNKVLEAMGGQWDRRAGTHVFPDDPTETIAAAVARGTTPNTDRKVLAAYFATPEALARLLVEGPHSDISALAPGAHVLEPSAGDGALVRAILAANPGMRITAVEPDRVRAAAIDYDPRVTVVIAEFEEFAAGATDRYAGVVMNPPFALPHRPTVWIDHLHTAWNLLAPGAQLLSLAPNGYTYRTDHAHRAVREIVIAHGGHEVLPAGSFTTSGTGAATVLLHARRPAEV